MTLNTIKNSINEAIKANERTRVQLIPEILLHDVQTLIQALERAMEALSVLNCNAPHKNQVFFAPCCKAREALSDIQKLLGGEK